jgi:four helix bundle protein
MSESNFKNLLVWQKSKALAVQVYSLTESGKLAKDFGLKDQLRRSAVSVCSNIAEGDERGTAKDSVRFLFMAKGSVAELRTQLEIAFEVGWLDEKQFQSLDSTALVIAKMLGALIKSRSRVPVL